MQTANCSSTLGARMPRPTVFVWNAHTLTAYVCSALRSVRTTYFWGLSLWIGADVELKSCVLLENAARKKSICCFKLSNISIVANFAMQSKRKKNSNFQNLLGTLAFGFSFLRAKNLTKSFAVILARNLIIHSQIHIAVYQLKWSIPAVNSFYALRLHY